MISAIQNGLKRTSCTTLALALSAVPCCGILPQCLLHVQEFDNFYLHRPTTLTPVCNESLVVNRVQYETLFLRGFNHRLTID